MAEPHHCRDARASRSHRRLARGRHRLRARVNGCQRRNWKDEGLAVDAQDPTRLGVLDLLRTRGSDGPSEFDGSSI
jgi:hypothetical protein